MLRKEREFAVSIEVFEHETRGYNSNFERNIFEVRVDVLLPPRPPFVEPLVERRWWLLEGEGDADFGRTGGEAVVVEDVGDAEPGLVRGASAGTPFLWPNENAILASDCTSDTHSNRLPHCIVLQIRECR